MVYTISIYHGGMMDKAKIFMNGKSQAVRLPKKYRFNSEEVLLQEHELGVLIVDPEKRWKVLEEIMGTMSEDFFSNGREKETWAKREKIK
jgi:antitoxin VapB